MAERTVDVNLDPTASASDKISEVDRENTTSREALKARLVEVYDRGVVGDRLFVQLPNDKVGQWVPSDTLAITRMESLGYQIDKEYAPKRRLHDKGDGASYVGDVVFMVASRETREIIDEIKRDRYERINNPKKGKQKEEKDFEGQTATLEPVGIKSFGESKVESPNVRMIRQIIDPQNK